MIEAEEDPPPVVVADPQPAAMRRRVAAVVGLLAVLLGAGLYFAGGSRVSGGGGSVSMPVTIGEEAHTMAYIDTGGGNVELLAARPAGVTGGMEVKVSLVDRGDAPSIGSSRGPLDNRYRLSDVAGHRVRSSRPDHLVDLDVRLVATRAGTHQLKGITVTYRAGFGRQRTARLQVPVCVSASVDWRTAPPADCPLPGLE